MRNHAMDCAHPLDFESGVQLTVRKPGPRTKPVSQTDAAPKSSGRRIASTEGFTVADLTGSLDWDEKIGGEASANIYASRSWGVYKERLRRPTRRVAIRGKDGRTLLYAQYHERKVGPARFILAQGCPILTAAGAKRAEPAFRAFVEHLALRPLDVLGVNYQEFQSSEAAAALLAIGFAPVVAPKNHTLEVDLSRDIGTVLAGVDRNFRRHLTRARQNPDLEAVFLTEPDARLRAFDRFAEMYAALQLRKGFSNAFNSTAYRDIAAVEPRLEFLEIRERGEPIDVRIVHKSATRWTDFFTASNHRALATSAATLSVWNLIERAKAEGVRVYDLGGIDPANNRGVFDFKRLLSRNVVQSTPLWLYSRSRIVRSAAVSVLVHR